MPDKPESLYYGGTDDLEICATELSERLLEALKDCGQPGCDAMPAVDFVLSEYNVTGDESQCRAYLKGYGAWDENELADHDANLRRLVWLTGCQLYEAKAEYPDSPPHAYFCTY